jgi:hypothetical protein
VAPVRDEAQATAMTNGNVERSFFMDRLEKDALTTRCPTVGANAEM